MKFENIPESVESREDTEFVLRSFLEKELGYVDAAAVEIQRVHRLRRKKERREIVAYSRMISEIQGLSKHACIRPPIARNQL